MSFTLHETGMNAPRNRYNICNFTWTTSSIVAMVSAVRDNSGWWLPAVRSIELIARNFRKELSNFVSSLTFCWGYSFKSLRVENILYSRRFWSQSYLLDSTYFHIPFHCIIITK